ncbi:uncharacterized protein LOC109859006 [Pseudomyrmex gracilis]|uniref:uncharacterized protein LOC109859006 n=1 Tax=Pseudomyrmex gracilis TaxID=219809 RepID=UPI000995B556|nr:uncharacterized protein LOC109859006 [Pseudomyrmex gracilis]
MGNCCGLGYSKEESSSYSERGYVHPEDADVMRRKLAEAAEKRIAEQQSRGLKDAEAAKRHQQRVSEIERREREAAKAGTSEPALKWQVN